MRSARSLLGEAAISQEKGHPFILTEPLVPQRVAGKGVRPSFFEPVTSSRERAGLCFGKIKVPIHPLSL